MPQTLMTPVFARPKSIVLLRGGQKVPLELSFEGLDHKNFGLWKISTKIRKTDQVVVTDLGYNYVRAEYALPEKTC